MSCQVMPVQYHAVPMFNAVVEGRLGAVELGSLLLAGSTAREQAVGDCFAAWSFGNSVPVSTAHPHY